MIGFNPNTRHPGLSVPTRRDARVAPSAKSGDAGAEHRGRALVPVKPIAKAANDSAPAKPANDVAKSCVRAGLSLQTDAPAPRRGLRADAVERRRYLESYEAARHAVPLVKRARLVRSA